MGGGRARPDFPNENMRNASDQYWKAKEMLAIFLIMFGGRMGGRAGGREGQTSQTKYFRLIFKSKGKPEQIIFT